MSLWSKLWQTKLERAARDLEWPLPALDNPSSDADGSGKPPWAGMTINFRPSAAAVEAYRAAISGYVAEIPGLQQADLTDVQRALWTAVMRGQSMAYFQTVLHERCGLSMAESYPIVRHQMRKAQSLMENVRRMELGITHAIWLHSHAVLNPRPSHKAFSGEVYELKKGAFLDGKWVWPGSEIGCHCLSRIIIPGYDDKKNARVIDRERRLKRKS